jgi:hypothetical protein
MSNKRSSLQSLISEVQALKEDESLSQWLLEALTTRITARIDLPAHLPITSLYLQCDPLLQKRFGKALAGILESFEPRLGADEQEREFLYSLLSLAATIRNDQIKERLRRWLYQDAFQDWYYDIFNLYGVLLLTTSAYDSDEDWLDFVMKILPTRSRFRAFAVETHRAILDTKGIDCLELLPNILDVVDSDDEVTSSRLSLLLGETIETFGADRFFSYAVKSINKETRDVADVCSNTLKLEHLVADEVSEEMDRWTLFLKERSWAPAIKRWQKAGSKLDTFKEIVNRCGEFDYILMPSRIIYGAYHVVTFRNGNYEIVIKSSDRDLSEFLGYSRANEAGTGGDFDNDSGLAFSDAEG